MGALLDAVPAGGADHTEHHRDLATAIEAGGGGGGGTTRLLDLGVVEATDLLAGPVTLYATPAGESVVAFRVGTYVNLDSSNMNVYVDGAEIEGQWLFLSDERPTTGGDRTIIIPGGDVKASIGGYGAAPWAAATVYAAGTYVIEAGVLWSTDGGTSGGSEPDFVAALVEGNVADNGMTWTQDVDAPTTGSLHVYALVAEAETP